MSILEKNRLIGVAFLVLGFFHLATLILTIFGYSVTYPYIVSTPEIVSIKTNDRALGVPTNDDSGFTSVIPGMPSTSNGRGTNPSPTVAPESKAQAEARKTMTMIYVMIGVQGAILLFILFAGYTVVNVRAGGRSLGIVASLFALFFYPLGTVISILAIWFLTGDECLELYSEVEKDKRAPQSII